MVWKVAGEFIDLKNMTVGSKGSFPFITFFDPDVVESPTHIEFGEVFPFEFINDFPYEGERISILDCKLI